MGTNLSAILRHRWTWCCTSAAGERRRWRSRRWCTPSCRTSSWRGPSGRSARWRSRRRWPPWGWCPRSCKRRGHRARHLLSKKNKKIKTRIRKEYSWGSICFCICEEVFRGLLDPPFHPVLNNEMGGSVSGSLERFQEISEKDRNPKNALAFRFGLSHCCYS